MRKIVPAACLAALVMYGSALAEAGYTLTVQEKPAPEAIDAEVRDQIEPKSYSIASGGTPIFEFWFAKQLELKKKPASSDEALKAIPEVSLLGAMIVHEPDHADFRDDYIDPGTYVLRLGLQPQDGNHMGTSPTDTFAVLVPADRDAEVREYPTHDDLAAISLEETAALHPPILNLQPLEQTEGEFPRLGVTGDDWQVLILKLPGKAGEDTVDVQMQMVFEGIGYL